MSSVPENAHERSPSGRPVLPGSSGDPGQPLQLAMRAFSRGLGFSIRAPELVLFVLFVTALAVGPILGGAASSAAGAETITCGDSIDASGTYVVEQNITASQTCFSIQADDVVIDGNGHTITQDGEGNHAVIINGSYQNVTVRNVTFDQWGWNAVYADGAGLTLQDVTVSNAYGNGVRLTNGDLDLENVTITDPAEHAVHLDGTAVTATSVDIGSSTASNTTMDFEAYDLLLGPVDGTQATHAEKTNVSRFFEATDDGAADAYLDVELHYEDADAHSVDESTMELARYDGSQWMTLQDSSVDTSANVVSGYTESFSDFGAFATEVEPITECTPIDQSGIYALENNLTATDSACIQIDAGSDVVIDGQGHSIDANGYDGILRGGQDQENFELRNLTITNADTAIDFDFVIGATLEDVTVTDSDSGLLVYNAESVSIADSAFRNVANDVVKADTPGTEVDATNVAIGDVTATGTAADFQGNDFRLQEIGTPASAPDGDISIERFLSIASISGSLDVTVPYDDEDAHGIDLSTLSLYRDDGGWQHLSSTVDREAQTVSTTGISSSGDLGTFAEESSHVEVTLDEVSKTVVEGETVVANVTLENTGPLSGTENVTLETDGVVRDETEVTLDVNETTTASLNWTTGAGDASVYAAAVASESDDATWTLRVADPDGAVWETDPHWNAGARERTVTDDVGDRVNDTVRLGYPSDANGLVSYWPLDEDSGSTAVDAAGSNDGSHVGNVAPGVAGLLGTTGYALDGSSSVSVPHDSSLEIEDRITVSFWVRTTSLGDGQEIFLVDKADRNNGGFDFLDTTDGVVAFRVHDGDEVVTSFNRSLIDDGGWHHVVGVHDTGTSRVYVDGQERDRASYDNDLRTISDDLVLGASTDGTNHLDGDLEEVQVYDRALDDQAVQSLYDTARNGRHTTDWRPLVDALNTASIELDATATVSSADATIYVESDVDGDGTVDEVSDPIALSNGTASYEVGGLETDPDTLRVRTEFATDDPSRTAVVDRLALENPANFRVDVRDAPTSVLQGETVAVNATVENVGDLNATKEVTLDLNGSVGQQDSTNVTLDGGENQTVSLEWTTDADDRGNYEATIASEDDSASETVRVDAPPYFDVTVTGTNTPIVENATLSVNATVQNTGDLDGEQSVTLTMDNGTDTKQVNSTPLALDAGASESISFEWTTGLGDADEYDAVVESDDDGDADPVSVVTEEDFQVTVDETNQPVVAGESLWVNATVENLGGVSETQQIDLTIDEDPVDTTNVALNGSERTTVNLTWGTTRGDVGNHTATVTSADGSDAADVTVFEPANLTVTGLETNSPVLEGSTLDVTATVRNEGDLNGTQELNLTIDGTREDVRSVTVNAGETKDVTLGWPTAAGHAGNYTATFHTENDSATTDVRVDAPANLTVDVLEHDASVVEGQQVDVTATVTNAGDVNATQNATLTLDSAVDGTDAGDPVASEEVSLTGHESTNVSLAWSTSEGDAGSYTATVATENDSATVDVDVLTPPELAVSITDANASVYENETLSVNATVENLGQAAANQTIGLNVSSADAAEEQVASTRVEVGGGNATTVTLDWAVDADATGNDATLNYTATVASEDDTDGTDVQVRDDQAYFVSIDDVGSPVTEGESVTVDATISARDGTGAAKNVSLHVGGTERDRTNVSIAGENETTVTLTWATGDDDAGTYAATVASEDHTDSASVTVESAGSGGFVGPEPPSEPAGTLDVAIEGTDDPVQIGEPLTVSARVSNGVDQELTETIALSARGAERDSQTVTLAPNGSRTIELQWVTTADDAGSHPVTVAGSGPSAVRYVDVVDEPAFDVEIEDTTSPIDAGRPLRVTASVTANANDTQTIALERPGGGTVDSQSVSLTAGESTTLTLTWRTARGDAGSGEVTVRGSDDAASAGVRIRSAGEIGVTLDRYDSTVVVNQSGAVEVTVENGERGRQTADVVLEVDGTERDVRTITLDGGARQSVALGWTPTDRDRGERELTVRAGQGSVTRTVSVDAADESGGLLGRAPQWAGATVDYEPTEQDTHVGGFLWLTALIAGAGAVLLATRPSLDGRLLAATLFVAAFRTSTDVVHAAFEEVATEQLLALNTSLELYVGLLFLSFTAAYVDAERLLRRRSLLALAGLGLAGTAAAATNARHGLVFGEVSLVGGPFTYVTAETGPLGWLLLAITLASLLASVGLLARSFLAGTDPTWRPVGVLAAGLCLAVVVVLLSAFERGPLPQYDYTGAGVGGFLIVATTTAVGHGLHRIKHDAQKSLIQDLDDPIVVATDARVVVDFNAAAAQVLPGIDDGVDFEELVSSALEWPAPGETTTGEYSLSEIVAPTSTRVDGDVGPPDAGPTDALTDGAGRGPAAVDDDRSATADPDLSATEGQDSSTTADHDSSPTGDRDPSTAGDREPSPSDDQEPSPTDDQNLATASDASSTDVAPEDDAHYLVQTTSVTADTGDSIGYTVRFTDVTELERRTAELTRRNAQLEQVASTISHDLRNPMTVADGYVEMLRETVPASDGEVQPATVSEHLEPVRESLVRMDEIIADILSLARSKDPASEERLAFGEAVEEAWTTVDTGQATLFVESAGTITADPGHLRRILENLFRNAVEHVGPDVAVLVGLTEDGFYVADDGPGIPEDRRDDVFEEGHTSNPDGTGLGLSIVSQLASTQDWHAHLDDEYDGAKFVLTGCETVTDGTGPSSWSGD